MERMLLCRLYQVDKVRAHQVERRTQGVRPEVRPALPCSFRQFTVVILVMQQPNKTNPIDATPTDKPYFTPHTISTHQNVKIGNQCIS